MRHLRRVVGLVMAALAFSGCAGQPEERTVAVQRGTLEVAVGGNGSVEPEQSAELGFDVSGTVAEVPVREGQSVSKGQILAALDGRALDQRVLQAEANLAMALARLDQAVHGNVTEQEKAVALAEVTQARAQHEQTVEGEATPATIAEAEAAVRAAQAGVARARSGNVTAADIAGAEADVREGEANLQRVRSGNATPADIANAEAVVASAEAELRAATAGPAPEEVSAAQTALTLAQQERENVAATSSANKTLAQQQMDQAADQVRIAQQAYSAAYWDNEQAKNGVNPRTGQRFEDEPLLNAIRDPEVRQRDYAEALETAKLQLAQAESQLAQAGVTYEQKKQQEINDVAAASARVSDAQVDLDQLFVGPDEAAVAAAQAKVDGARAQLAKLTEGGTAADVAAAQAQLDGARARLAKLSAGGTAADVAAAQAQLDGARARVASLAGGGTEEQIAAAQALVDAAQARLEGLSAGVSPSDRQIAEAVVTEAKAELAAAQLDRANAVLRAPFAGTIALVNVAPGDRISAASLAEPLFSLADTSELHVEVNVAETDIANVREGQDATVTVDAMVGEPLVGQVSFIAPTGTTLDNITTYRVRIELPRDEPALRAAMSATVEIGVAQRENVLLVPARAIWDDGAQRFVRVQRGGAFVDTQVTTGLSNDMLVEVVSGVEAGDIIAARGAAAPPASDE